MLGTSSSWDFLGEGVAIFMPTGSIMSLTWLYQEIEKKKKRKKKKHCVTTLIGVEGEKNNNK
jgi:hypothetical protein